MMISLRSSKNPSFVTIKQKVNFTNESIIHANTEKYTKFCAIKATNHQSLVSREFIKKDFLIKNHNFWPFSLQMVNCVLIFQRLKFSWVQFSCQRINNYRLHLLKIAKIFFCCPFHADWFNIFQLIFFFIEKDCCLTINFNFLLPI